jgi:hypothetical protein
MSLLLDAQEPFWHSPPLQGPVVSQSSRLSQFRVPEGQGLQVPLSQ